MTVREILASLGDQDEEAEVFVVTSSDGRHIDGTVELAFVEELPLPDGRRVLACVPRYAVRRPLATAQPVTPLGRTEETQPAA
jgi:hypothetical protein